MAKNSRFEQNPIYTEPYPLWIEQLPLHRINRPMMELVQFYVINSPCKESSWGRKSMESYGWINYWESSRFRDLIFDVAELNELHPCGSATDFERIWPDMPDYYRSQDEFAYFVKAGEESPLMNLFHRIRNSFSHGRFCMNGDYFFFEDVEKDKNGIRVMARICLNIVTLQNWMRIIKCDGETAKKLYEDMKKNREKK